MTSKRARNESRGPSATPSRLTRRVCEGRRRGGAQVICWQRVRLRSGKEGPARIRFLYSPLYKIGQTD